MFIFLLVLLLIPSYTYAEQFVCKAPDYQANICASNYDFTPVSEPELDLGISNPVNMATGEKLLKEVDIPESNNSLPAFIRFYRSGSTPNAVWLHNYSIAAKPLGNKQWQISFPNGQKFIANNIQQADGSLYWSPGQNRNFVFDQDGKLTALQTPNGQTIKLTYYDTDTHNSHLKSVQLGEQSLVFKYQTNGKTTLLTSLVSALGKFEYVYNNGLIEKVIRPDGMWKQYQYSQYAGQEHLIIGISLHDTKGNSWQARSWLYDQDNRVIQATGANSDFLKFAYKPSTTNIKSAHNSTDIKFAQINGRTKISLINSNNKINQIAYDKAGRTKEINGLLINRYPNGRIKRLTSDYGWPGLILNYDPQTRLQSWFSKTSNSSQIFYHNNGQLQGILYANSDRLEINPDNIGRPTTISYTNGNGSKEQVQLAWHGQQLSKLENNYETEYLNYQQQLSSRIIMRGTTKPIIYKEEYLYDENNNLQKQILPDGGQLIYTWQGSHVTDLKWLDKHGAQHTVISTKPGLAGYAHGNGLHTQVLHAKDQSWLAVSKDQQLIWGEHRQKQNNLLQQTILTKNNIKNQVFAHDKYGRTIAIQQDNHTNWLAWADDGQLIAKSANNIPTIKRDASGLPIKYGEFELIYQAQRRLAKIKHGSKTISEYKYNARGQRIHQQYGSHKIDRFYTNNRLSEIWHTQNGLLKYKQRYIYANGMALGLIQTDSSDQSQLYFIHNNQIGAPIMVTDKYQNIVWQADYDLFGKAHIMQADIDMPLRLPGQDQDPVTGWHDNVFRTYLPELGQYLEPDPLGPIPGQQAFGYAKQQPLKFTDPLGLVLLAFDGTRYNQHNLGNVWKLSQAYNDGPSFYHFGPGNSYYVDWDAAVAASSRQIQENQWQSLMNVLEQAQKERTTVPIDILGYSRGAALARDFANKITANTKNGWFSYDDPVRGNIGVCVDLRFLGLFDTVAQFGILGAANAGYDLNINGAWQWVAHAVASHELRTLFPLVSLDTDGSPNSIEVPFIGAHADIGGGMILDESLQPVPNGDLSDVALNWMYWQARAALVPQNDLAADDTKVSQALLHDERSIIEKSLLTSDRNIQDANTKTIGPQGANPTLGEQQRLLFESFINRLNIQPKLNVVGTVNMQAYDAWLQQNLGMPSVID